VESIPGQQQRSPPKGGRYEGEKQRRKAKTKGKGESKVRNKVRDKVRSKVRDKVQSRVPSGAPDALHEASAPAVTHNQNETQTLDRAEEGFCFVAATFRWAL
jgi:hypothetical protein